MIEIIINLAMIFLAIGAAISLYEGNTTQAILALMVIALEVVDRKINNIKNKY